MNKFEVTYKLAPNILGGNITTIPITQVIECETFETAVCTFKESMDATVKGSKVIISKIIGII